MKVTARRSSGYVHELSVRQHTIIGDELADKGGTDTGPDPQELLALSLASCAAITVEMYADRKGWDVGALEVEVDYEPDPKGQCARFEVLLKLPASLTEDQVARIMLIAKKCPVHRTLLSGAAIEDRVELV